MEDTMQQRLKVLKRFKDYPNFQSHIYGEAPLAYYKISNATERQILVEIWKTK